MEKPKVATISLAGCFGCHMSLLDIDDRLIDLLEVVDFGPSPINDLKRFSERCRIGLIEGGCANEENVHVLQAYRENCDVLVAVGDCATGGGIPAMRNMVPLQECLDEAFADGPSVHNPSGEPPNDPEIPLLLDRVYPAHEVVRIDAFLPGCPPSADAFEAAITALLRGEPLQLPYALLKYD